MTTKSPIELQYQLPHLDNVENVEKYRNGGYHPVHLGDTFKNGRYRVVHKLGYGGFSTVWVARDKIRDRLVSLKVLTAEASRQPTELRRLWHLDEHAQGNPRRSSIIVSLDSFTFQGPNGTHLCYVSQPGGPSIASISDSPGEIAGTRRLRAPLARKLARQLAKAVSLLHDVGIIHGDITPKNVLLRLKSIDAWSTEVIHQQVGRPVRAQIFTSSGQEPDVSAPKYLVEPASFYSVDLEYISDQVLLIDLGEAFSESSPPPNGVGTPVSYRSPELTFENKASRASDLWALACTIFELRAGFPLFESFVGSSAEVLDETVRILGVPPESSHPLRKQDGIVIADDAKSKGSNLNGRIREIGMYDHKAPMRESEAASLSHHTLLEPCGMSITADEANSLTNLLRRTLDYTPEKRLSAEKIGNHSWLADSQ